MHRLGFLSYGLLCARMTLASRYTTYQRVSYPLEEFEGPSIAEDISREGFLDGPKIEPGVNTTAFDWWYFDAVSPDSRNESIAIVFNNHGRDSLVVPFIESPFSVQFYGTFDNGTQFLFGAETTEGVVFETGTDGFKSDWPGTGASIRGSSLNLPNPEYTVTFNNTKLGIFGKITLKSTSPPRYPCDVNKPGVSQEIIPTVYWSNAQPDAIATVDFTVQGKALKFTGVGYHDKNWGTAGLSNKTLRSWYWGHAHLGPYSLVWFDGVTPDGSEHFSSWITENGTIISKSCEPNSVVVRPWGDNIDFPPVLGAAAPSGYTFRFDLGEKGTFAANFTRQINNYEIDIYKRMIGPITGGIEGGQQHTGRSLCEQFQYFPK